VLLNATYGWGPTDLIKIFGPMGLMSVAMGVLSMRLFKTFNWTQCAMIWTAGTCLLLGTFSFHGMTETVPSGRLILCFCAGFGFVGMSATGMSAIMSEKLLPSQAARGTTIAATAGQVGRFLGPASMAEIYGFFQKRQPGTEANFMFVVLSFSYIALNSFFLIFLRGTLFGKIGEESKDQKKESRRKSVATQMAYDRTLSPEALAKKKLIRRRWRKIMLIIKGAHAFADYHRAHMQWKLQSSQSIA